MTTAAMRLRHALIPYIYTAAWRNHTAHEPLVRPMYHDHAAQEAAYHCPDQYLFGSELLVAPFSAPADAETRLSRQVVWLPAGDWFDFFNADRYPGDGWHALYGTLRDIPVFARAGGIVPLAARSDWSATENPRLFAVHLFPGADNEFLLYEDDDAVASSRTPFRLDWSTQKWQATIAPSEGDSAFLPAERSFELHFRGIVEAAEVTAELDGQPVEVNAEYEAATRTLKVAALTKNAEQKLVVAVTAAADALQPPEDYRLPVCRRMVRAFRMDSWVKQRLDRDLPAILKEPRLLAKYELSLSAEQIRALAEAATGSGFHRGSVRRANEEAIVLWNNHGSDAASFTLVAEDFNHRPEITSGPLPKFAVLHVGEDRLRLQKGSQTAGGQIGVSAWFDSLPDRLGADLAGGVTAVVQFDIQGVQGRSAALMLAEGEKARLMAGFAEAADVTITAEDEDWLALINGLIAPEEAFLSGKIKLIGNLELVLHLAGVISLAPPSTYLTGRWRFDVDFLDVLRVALGTV